MMNKMLKGQATKEEMLQVLEETGLVMRNAQKWSVSRLERMCISKGFMVTCEEELDENNEWVVARKECAELRHRIHVVKETIAELAKEGESNGDVFGAVNGMYGVCDEDKIAELNTELEELKGKMLANKHYKFLNNVGTVRWDF